MLEARSREHVIHRVRAGVLEQATVELLTETGLGERLAREGLVHHGIELRWGGVSHRIPLTELTGRSIWIYGQQEVVKDLIDARVAANGCVLFEVEGVSLAGIDGSSPTLRYRHAGDACELVCDFVAGCDGFHGVSRDAIPKQALRLFQTRLPVRVAGRARRRRALHRGADLRVARARLRAPQPALAQHQPALPAGRARHRSSPTGPTSACGRSCGCGWPGTASRCATVRCSRRASPPCAASSSSRCSTAGCSSRATPPTSCRPPAPRG